MRCLNVSIINDDDLEGDETFTVTLDIQVLPGFNVNVGQTVITINDDEGE